MIFEPSDALKLRQKRIVGHPIGPSDGGPYCISEYAARVVLSQKLATFKKLVPFEQVSLEDNKAKFAQRHRELIDQEREQFVVNRRRELAKRNIPETPRTMKEFDEQKMRLDIPNSPDEHISALKSVVMTDEEVSSIIDASKLEQSAVFGDLYSRGFYVSSGLKFACDFLVYQGDPVRYHAQYAVKMVKSIDGSVDLARENFNEINGFQRLTHCANKIPVFATYHNGNVTYWTLDDREYLTPTSASDIFKPIGLHLRNVHKHGRTD